MYGLDFEWVEHDPVYIDGYVYLRLKGSKRPAIFASITRQWKSGILKKQYQYVLKISFRDAATGSQLGGYYDSRAQAVAACKQIMKDIFHDPRDDVPKLELVDDQSQVPRKLS